MGWAEGLQSGMALGNLINQGFDRRELAEEAKKHQITEGAYGPALQQNIDQVRALQAQNPEQAAQYEPAIQELTRRQGLAAPDYSYGGQTFTSRQDAEAAAALGRTQGLANVYRSQGNIEKAEELTGRAQQQQLLGLQLKKSAREEETAVGTKAASDALAELKAAGRPVTSQTIAELAKTHKGDYNTLLQGEVAQLGYDEKSAAVEMKNLKRDLSKAAVGGIPSLNKFLADKFDPNKADNISPEIVQTKAGFTVMYGGKVLNEYGTHKSLSELIGTVHGQIDGDPLGTLKTLAAIRASDASVAAHAAEAGLTPIKGDYYRAMANAYNAKPETAASVAENKIYDSLTKSDAWQAAERKGDTSTMNRLMIGRGLDPARHGGGAGMPTWGDKKPAPTAPAAPAPAAEPEVAPEVGIDTTRYSRTKGPRGNFVYTPNQRSGLTKQQYEELDANRP